MENQHQWRWPRSQRLTKNAQFQRVRSQGRSWAHPLLVLAAYPNTEGLTRVGLTTGRRVGPAVSRNRARRLLREAARLCYPHICPGWDLVLIARPPICKAQMPQVRQALESLLRRARLSTGQEECDREHGLALADPPVPEHHLPGPAALVPVRA